jgi:hypothetical protein
MSSSETVPAHVDDRVSEGTELGTVVGSGSTAAQFNEPPPLQTPHKKRRLILSVGVFVATLDLCVLPIVYFYALTFGTSMNRQDSKSYLPWRNILGNIP